MAKFLKRHKIEFVFIDWFGVLSTNFYWCVQSKKHVQLKNWCDLVFGNKTVLDDWMRGKYTLEELCVLNGNINHSFVLESFMVDMDYYAPDADLMSTLKLLFQGAEKILVSDNMSLFDHILTRYTDINMYFSRKYLSHEIGKLKMDAPNSLFDHILTDMNLRDFRGGILIDDDIKNCNYFKSKGGRFIHVG